MDVYKIHIVDRICSSQIFGGAYWAKLNFGVFCLIDYLLGKLGLRYQTGYTGIKNITKTECMYLIDTKLKRVLVIHENLQNRIKLLVNMENF